MLQQTAMRKNSYVYQAKSDEQEWEFDPIGPSQFYDRLRPDEPLQPEKRLILAVLEEAIAEFKSLVQKIAQESRRRERRLLQENDEWFASDETTWPYSFENICSTVQIDADYMRQGLKQWKQHKIEAARRQAERVVPLPPRPASQVNTWRPVHALRPLARYPQRRVASALNNMERARRILLLGSKLLRLEVKMTLPLGSGQGPRLKIP